MGLTSSIIHALECTLVEALGIEPRTTSQRGVRLRKLLPETPISLECVIFPKIFDVFSLTI
jgi:hypothetical protein